VMLTLGVATKPEPLTVTEVPTGPVALEMAILAPTANMALASLLSASLALMLYEPPVTGRMVTLTVNRPLASVFKAEAPISPPDSKVMALLAAKPVPVMVISSPTKPLAALRVILRPTVMVALASLLSASLTLMVCVPPTTPGILNMTPLKLPLESVVTAGETITGLPSEVEVGSRKKLTALLLAKLWPAMVISSPVKPLFVLRVIFWPTVKVAEAAFEAASLAITVLAPREVAGTVKVALNPPVVPVVTAAGVVALAMPSKVREIGEVPEKPLPVMETVSPEPPVMGVKIILEFTVKLAETAFAKRVASTALTM
jgi:hypothetical protein